MVLDPGPYPAVATSVSLDSSGFSLGNRKSENQWNGQSTAESGQGSSQNVLQNTGNLKTYKSLTSVTVARKQSHLRIGFAAKTVISFKPFFPLPLSNYL